MTEKNRFGVSILLAILITAVIKFLLFGLEIDESEYELLISIGIGGNILNLLLLLYYKYLVSKAEDENL